MGVGAIAPSNRILFITVNLLFADGFNIFNNMTRKLVQSHQPTGSASVQAWLSSATSPSSNKNTNHLISKVERRTAPIDGGATIIYKPSLLDRGEYHLDTTMGCVGWRETVNCDPYGAVVSTNKLPCGYNVDSKSSGFCECQVSPPLGPIVRFGHTTCGHSSFRCHDVCKLPPKRQCQGFTYMDACEVLPAGHGADGWDFLKSKATTCNVNMHTAPLAAVPNCWKWHPENAAQCHDIISSTTAGYCECGSSLLRPEAPESGGLTRVRLECGHAPLSCAFICSADPYLSAQSKQHSHLNRYTAPPPAHLSWAWHSKAGLWNSILTDFQVNTVMKSSGMTDESVTDKVVDWFGFGQQCAEAFAAGGHGAGGPGCIGARVKWSLTAPFSQELRALLKKIRSEKIPTWTVGLGISAASSQIVAKAQAEALISALGQPNNMFDQLPQCTKFASVGDCAKVYRLCPLSCGALYHNLSPSPELCFPIEWKQSFLEPVPSADEGILSTVLQAFPTLDVHKAIYNAKKQHQFGDKEEKYHLIDYNESDVDPLVAKLTKDNERGNLNSGNVVGDYLRGLKRARTMRVVLLCYVNLKPTFNKMKKQILDKDAVHKVWSTVISTLSKSVARFHDYRILIHVNNLMTKDIVIDSEIEMNNKEETEGNKKNNIKKIEASIGVGDLRAVPRGLNSACGNVSKVHCQAISLPLQRSSMTTTTSSSVNNQHKEKGYIQKKKSKKNKESHRRLLNSNQDESRHRKLQANHENFKTISDHEEMSAISFAKSELFDMYRHAENGKLLSNSDLVILYDASELYLRIVKEEQPRPYFARPLLSPSSTSYSLLGWDSDMLIRSIGRVSPLGGFDVLCASPPPKLDQANGGTTRTFDSLSDFQDLNEPFLFRGTRFATTQKNEMKSNSNRNKHNMFRKYSLESRKRRRLLLNNPLPYKETNPLPYKETNPCNTKAPQINSMKVSNTNLIKVQSCFNGLAIYNPSALQHCEYSKHFNPIINLKENLAEVQKAEGNDVVLGECEHHTFDECLGGSGFGRIFVDPLLTHHTQGLVPHRRCLQLDDPSGAITESHF